MFGYRGQWLLMSGPGRSSPVAVINGYRDCPDLARIDAGRVGASLVLEDGRVKARSRPGVTAPGLSLWSGLGDLYAAVRGCRALIEPPCGWAGGPAARWRELLKARPGPVASGRGSW